MRLTFVEYVLPTHWACAFFNADTTGLDDDDEKAFDAWNAWLHATHGESFACAIEDEPEFAWEHDASSLGVLACDVSTYTFSVHHK